MTDPPSVPSSAPAKRDTSESVMACTCGQQERTTRVTTNATHLQPMPINAMQCEAIANQSNAMQ
eukprot:1833235-Pyramimonas_sp.AAC.1